MADLCNTHIICFGNPLHGDDGFGTAVYEALQKHVLPENTKLLDGGTSSLSALNLFDDCDYAIVVDAIHDDKANGDLNWYEPDAFCDEENSSSMSSHGLGVGSILKGLKILEEEGEPIPELEILTCSVDVPKSFKMVLSDPVEASILQAVKHITDKLEEVR